MNTFRYRDELKAELTAAAGGSWAVVWRAMNTVADRRQSSLLDRDEVLAEIASQRGENGGAQLPVMIG